MWSCGLMDKASDFGSGDCRFESCHDRFEKNISFFAASILIIYIHQENILGLGEV